MSEPGYYGRPIVKPPEWTGFIPLYFWAGGLAGACGSLAFAERLARNGRLARVLIIGAAAGSAVSGFCLIADLKRPARFLHMLRVFKPSSPMSVGVYIYSAFAGAAMTAVASEFSGVARPLGRFAEFVAALTGPWMAVYTSVLIGDTAMPAWHYARTSMPLLFAATSASCAGAVGTIAAPADCAKSARRLALLGGATVPLALERVRAELGPVQRRAYERGKAGKFAALARALNIAGTIGTLFAGRSKKAARFAGVALLAGGLAERFAVYHAGRISAEDPSFVIAAQRREEPG